ncbi:MAG: hypothetical protein M1838_002019 [Thelocarpon superellum]|nr:MAG: hypothetical protein M1838_002019 [Thelocarpon superellum]
MNIRKRDHDDVPHDQERRAARRRPSEPIKPIKGERKSRQRAPGFHRKSSRSPRSGLPSMAVDGVNASRMMFPGPDASHLGSSGLDSGMDSQGMGLPGMTASSMEEFQHGAAVLHPSMPSAPPRITNGYSPSDTIPGLASEDFDQLNAVALHDEARHSEARSRGFPDGIPANGNQRNQQHRTSILGQHLLQQDLLQQQHDLSQHGLPPNTLAHTGAMTMGTLANGPMAHTAVANGAMGMFGSGFVFEPQMPTLYHPLPHPQPMTDASIGVPPMDDHPSPEEFETVVKDYISSLSTKKQDKALITQDRYENILLVLKEPRCTTVESAQFRFWAKKMFTMGYNTDIGQRVMQNGSQRAGKHRSERPLVFHEGKPVAVREELYEVLTTAHSRCQHGGRDKTSAEVRRVWSCFGNVTPRSRTRAGHTTPPSSATSSSPPTLGFPSTRQTPVQPLSPADSRRTSMISPSGAPTLTTMPSMPTTLASMDGQAMALPSRSMPPMQFESVLRNGFFTAVSASNMVATTQPSMMHPNAGPDNGGAMMHQHVGPNNGAYHANGYSFESSIYHAAE